MDEFPILKLPEDLIRYTLIFVDPDNIHNLYRICKRFNKILSERRFLLSKLEYDLQINRVELKPLFDLPSSLRTLTPYLRYLRVLAFHNRIIRGSGAWLDPDTCIMEAFRAGDINMVKYFSGSNSEYLLGTVYTVENASECIQAHLRGESVKCDTSIYDIVELENLFKAAKDVLKDKAPKFDNSDDAFDILQFMVDNKKYKMAIDLAKEFDLLEDLERMLLNRFIKDESLAALEIHRKDWQGIPHALYESRNYEFIKKYLEKYPELSISDHVYWSPEFARALFESGKIKSRYYSVPPLYLLNYRDKIKRDHIRVTNTLAADIMVTVYKGRVTNSCIYCRCRRVPLKATRCTCGKFLWCNFCEKVKRPKKCPHCGRDILIKP